METGMAGIPKPGHSFLSAGSGVKSKNRIFLIGAILLLLLVGLLVTDSFVNAFNLSRLLRQISISGIIAIGMTFVIAGGNGGIDLSVGSTFGLASMVAMSLQTSEILSSTGQRYQGFEAPLPVIVFACSIMGAAVGLINGIGVCKLKIPPFIMTMVTMTVGRGLVLVYCDGNQYLGVRDDFKAMGSRMWGGYLPQTALIFLAIGGAAFLLLHKTAFGREVFATGANERAARISGVRTNRVIISTYIICGVLAAISGMLFTAFSTVAAPYAGEGYETTAISIVLIGGTPMAGGKGSMAGTLLGVLFVGLLQNLLKHLDINAYIQQLILAFIILAVVLVQRGQKTGK